MVLAVYLAIRVNPDNKFVMGGLAFLFPEVYLLQRGVRMLAGRAGPAARGTVQPLLPRQQSRLPEPQFIKPGHFDWDVALPATTTGNSPGKVDLSRYGL